MDNSEFLYRDLPTVKKRVHRLGLAFNYGIKADGVQSALDAGINYLFWAKFRKGEQLEVIQTALKRDRERYVFASGAAFGFFGGSIRRGAEKVLRSFDIDYIDVFQIFWLGKMSALTKAVQRELVQLKEEGIVRSLGVSIHDRPRAARLAEHSPFDLLMIRYNAAHPGAEAEIFPSYQKRRPLTVAYTATSWRKLLKAPKQWDGPPMSAGDCYRFCLSSPNVDVALCAPKNYQQMEENLEVLNQGPLSAEEDERVRRFGKAVHG